MIAAVFGAVRARERRRKFGTEERREEAAIRPTDLSTGPNSGTLRTMNCRTVALVLLVLLSAGVVLGQSGTSIPSTDEILELLGKADEKVTTFQDAVKQVQPDLDRADPKLSKKYLDAASTAHELIRATKKNGVSGYRLLGLLATLDDLSIDAATGAVMLLISVEKPKDPHVLSQVMLLMSAKNGCNDIAELIMHATMRLIYVEEDLLEKVVKQ